VLVRQGDAVSCSAIGQGLVVLDLFTDRTASPVMTPARLDSLERDLEVLDRDEGVGLVIVRGGLRAFCLGAELAFIGSAPPVALRAYLDQGRRVCDRIASLKTPTIAAVGGLALGGGFEFALACDVCWIDRRAAFGFPEASAGLVPAWGGMELAMQRMPRGLAWELLLGRRMGSAGAQACGLATRVFSSRGFEDAVLAEATTWIALGPEVLRSLKRSAATAAQGPAGQAANECIALLAQRKAA
jgi:enoyl-CoA hydratase/carnithine racemase